MVIYHRIKESIYAVEKDYDKILHKSWVRELSDSLLHTEYMDNLQCYIAEVYKATDFIYPKIKDDVFKAFKQTNLNDIKVVIFGDEPAPNVYSNGLAFGAYKTSAATYQHLPIHSKNIKQCLDPDNERDLNEFDPTLLSWTEQKVLLLNTSLISEYGNVRKHEYVFRNFIREIIKEISNASVEIVFVFTSSHQAEHFEGYIDLDFHTVLHYDGIDPDSSMFEDINTVLRENRGESNMIEW